MAGTEEVTDVPHQEDPVQDDKVKEVLKNEESECGTAPEKEDKDQLGDSENKSGGATGKGKLSKSVSISEEPEFTKSGSLSKQKKRSTKRKKSTSASDDKDDRPEIRPRTKSSSYDPRVGVELALGKGRLQDLPPKTVWQVFKETVTRIPDNTAMRYKESSDGEWQSMSYSEYHDQVIQAAKSFLKLGVEKFYSVCVIGFNSPEWVIANLGAMFCGALPAGIYTTNGPEACHFVASNCRANVIVVENNSQLEKILQIRSRLPDLKAIVQYKGEVSPELKDVYSWKDFMELGRDVPMKEIDVILEATRPEHCALLIYTSGTTGNPKGVMLSHDNLTWTANCLIETYGNLEFGNEHVISYLPLSHMAAQMGDIYMPISIGGTVHFAQPDALKGSLGATLRDARPTIFFGVPRVYEKIMESMQAKLAEVQGLKKKLINWGAKKGIKGNYKRQSSSHKLPVGWSVAEKLVFNKIRDLVGFQRAKILVIGSAPTRQEVHEFFMSFNMPLMELYGMSESSGPQTFNVNSVKGKWKTGSCGPLVPGAHLKIHEPNENGEGEICFYGRHVFMGYLNNEQKTKETIDEDGWLHSGDIGKVDEDGFLYITGRIKELIITSGGENIPPVPIEYRIKAEVPFLSNVFLIGDHRKYLTCLVTLLCNMDPDSGEPLDDLTPAAVESLEELGCSCTKVSQVLETRDSAVYTAIQEGLDGANKEAISNAQKVQKFTILGKDFSIPGGELGPTLKVRRPKVVAKYEAEIDAMYNQ